MLFNKLKSYILPWNSLRKIKITLKPIKLQEITISSISLNFIKVWSIRASNKGFYFHFKIFHINDDIFWAKTTESRKLWRRSVYNMTRHFTDVCASGLFSLNEGILVTCFDIFHYMKHNFDKISDLKVTFVTISSNRCSYYV